MEESTSQALTAPCLWILLAQGFPSSVMALPSALPTVWGASQETGDVPCRLGHAGVQREVATGCVLPSSPAILNCRSPLQSVPESSGQELATHPPSGYISVNAMGEESLLPTVRR